MITIIGCNKGGAGKTTTATNVAVALSLRGFDVCLMDADPQRSAARWHADREEANIEPRITLVEKLENLSQTLISLNEKYDHIVVDVAGRNSRELITGGAVADQIIAPHQGSQLDLDTLQELERQTVRLRDLNPKLKVWIYHSMASTNPTVRDIERNEFLDYVSDLEGFTPMKSIGFFRKVYRDVISGGQSVLEAANQDAINEVNELIDEAF